MDVLLCFEFFELKLIKLFLELIISKLVTLFDRLFLEYDLLFKFGSEAIYIGVWGLVLWKLDDTRFKESEYSIVDETLLVSRELADNLEYVFTAIFLIF
jgi:hypothetical protein